MKTLAWIVALATVLSVPSQAQEPARALVSVEGTVRDSSGTAISGVWLIFQPMAADEADPNGESVRASVDETGRFQVDLPRGSYVVLTAPPLCGVAPPEFAAVESGSADVVLALGDVGADPVGEQPGFAARTLDTALPTQWSAGITATPFGPQPYFGATWSRSFSFQDVRWLPGGHMVRTDLCDSRLLKPSPSDVASPKPPGVEDAR